jgi:hypothetical protein
MRVEVLRSGRSKRPELSAKSTNRESLVSSSKVGGEEKRSSMFVVGVTGRGLGEFTLEDERRGRVISLARLSE